MIRKKTARRICEEWHSGQWSGFYSYASSGLYSSKEYDYIYECKECLKTEGLKEKDRKELENLLLYFERLKVS